MGKVEYAVGFANIREGHLIEYSGLQRTEPEGFWYR